MRFVVPQFIDVEDKIIGPLSVRQFLISLATVGFMYFWWKVLSFFPFILASLLTIAIGATFAFVKVNGQAFHYFLLNIVHDARRPRLRIWNSRDLLRDQQIGSLHTQKQKKAVALDARKPPLTVSRLAKLALVVDTGGSFRDDNK